MKRIWTLLVIGGTIAVVATVLTATASAANQVLVASQVFVGSPFCVNGQNVTSTPGDDAFFNDAATNSPVFTDVGTPAQSTEPGETSVDAIQENEFSLTSDAESGLTVKTTVTRGACAALSVWIPSGPDRYIFCAAQGNKDMNGKAIVPGSSLNIFPDQALNDPLYKGATIGFWVPGEGATCSLTPAQASLAAASTKRVNHVGGTGDINQPEVYTLVK